MTVGGLLLFDDSSQGAQTARRRFGGLTMVERGIRTMARAGVRRLLVVLPEGVDVSLSRLTRNLELELEFVLWGNEPSLRFSAGEDVLVLLGDHVHHHSSLTHLVSEGTGGDGLAAQVSPVPPQDAVSFHAVRTGEGGLRFQSDRAEAEASTGALLSDGGLHPHEIVTTGVPALEFLSVRAAGRPVRTLPGDADLWRRVVDRRSARRAKAMLFGQVTKKTSGPISRHINARLSIPISKVLIETGISPHMVTVLFVLTTGLAAAYLVSHPEPYWRLALAGFLWQMAAVLDRCDGEIARVKLCESKFGAWFDTVTDNIAYVTTYGAFLMAADNMHPEQPLYLYAGLSSIGAMLLTLGIMYRYALRTGSGSLQNYLVGFARLSEGDKGFVYRALESFSFMAKRDSFSFVHFVCAILGSFELMYLYTVGGLHIVLLGALVSQRKMLTAHHRQAAAPAEPLTAIGSPASVTEEAPSR
jgi:phosphatidylglycerophosphate synthase